MAKLLRIQLFVLLFNLLPAVMMAQKNNASRKVSASSKEVDARSFLNNYLHQKYGRTWEVATDATQKYDTYYMDSFIIPVRKNNPDYPNIVKGDFDGDKKQDYAAIVVSATKHQMKLVIVLGGKNAYFLDEEGAISLYKKQVLRSPYEKATIKMKADGILNEYFEKSATIIYWNGKAFKKYFISD